MVVKFLDTIVLLGCLQGFILCAILYFNPPKRLAERLLAALLFLLSLASLNIYLSESDMPRFAGVVLSLVPTIIFMPFGPLIYFYTKSQLDPAFRLEWEHKVHFLPVVIDVLPAIAAINKDCQGSMEFFEESFKKMKDRKIKNLIIDVRRNGGGWDDFGFKLFSYLIKKPTRYYDSLYTSITDIDFLLKYTDKDSAWLKESESLWWKDGKPLPSSVSEGLSLQQPQPNRFDGDVYVLMDGGSMSTTAEFTAATHYNKLATFIGEESGGAYEGGNGADFTSVILPHTRLFVNIPLAKYVMATSGAKHKGRGTIPDYQISKTVKDWYELRDPQLEFALHLIKEKNKQ